MNNFNNNPNNNPNNFNPNNFNQNNPNNNLLNGFYRHQQNQIPFQQNTLLNNNPIMQSNANYSQSNQQQNMNRMQMLQNMQYIKQMQYIKRLEKIKELDKMKMDDDKIREYVIHPEKIIKNKDDNEKINVNYNLLEKMYQSEESFKSGANKFWNDRTNEPYKNIIKDTKYYEQFLTEQKRKKLDNKDELIVHKVTLADKDEDLLEEEWYDKEQKIEKHDNELKMIYSTSKEAEHKKKFEYNHKYKYRMKYDPSDHSEMKKDKIEYYKKEQEKHEKNNKKMEDIIEEILEKDLLSTDQLKKLGINNIDNTIEVDMEQLESKLKEQYGSNIFDEKIKQVDKNTNNVIKDNEKLDNESNIKPNNESDDESDNESDDESDDESDGKSDGESDDESDDESDGESDDESDDDESDGESDKEPYNEPKKVNSISDIKTRVRIGKRKEI